MVYRKVTIFIAIEVFVKISKTSTIFNGTSAQLKHGKWVRILDLLYGTMLPSGNDAAFLLSEVMGLLLFYERMKP
jgi:D-alanyl-D-alanine carboxypeptidase